MRLLRTLEVGSRFRPAHPGQVSKNGRRMCQEYVYSVSRIFPMEPGLYVCHLATLKKNDGGPYTLHPDVPVLLPKEPPTTAQAAEAAVIGNAKKRVVVGYVMLYDGKSLDVLRSRLPKQMVQIISFMQATGLGYFDREVRREVLRQLDGKVSKKVSAEHLFLTYARRACEEGFLQEVLEDKASVVGNLVELFGIGA